MRRPAVWDEAVGEMEAFLASHFAEASPERPNRKEAA